MIDYHWHLDLSPAQRLLIAAVALALIAVPLWLGRRQKDSWAFRLIWPLPILLLSLPAMLNRVPEFIELHGDALRFNQGPAPSSHTVQVPEIERIEEARAQRGSRSLHVVKKGSPQILTMPKPPKPEEFQRLLAVLRSRGIAVTTLDGE